MFENFPEKCRTIRKQKGLSLTELSRLTGINQSSLQRMETNRTKKIPADRIILIEKALGLPRGYFLEEDLSKDSLIQEAVERIQQTEDMLVQIKRAMRTINKVTGTLHILALERPLKSTKYNYNPADDSADFVVTLRFGPSYSSEKERKQSELELTNANKKELEIKARKRILKDSNPAWTVKSEDTMSMTMEKETGKETYENR